MECVANVCDGRDMGSGESIPLLNPYGRKGVTVCSCHNSSLMLSSSLLISCWRVSILARMMELMLKFTS